MNDAALNEAIRDTVRMAGDYSLEDAERNALKEHLSVLLQARADAVAQRCPRCEEGDLVLQPNGVALRVTRAARRESLQAFVIEERKRLGFVSDANRAEHELLTRLSRVMETVL